MKKLLVTPSRCTGCRSCEIACSFSHPRHGGAPGKSSIRAFLTKAPDEGIPIVCLQCDSAACVAVCPSKALVRNDKTGAIELVEERCVHCYSCLVACPFGNIALDVKAHSVVKCDLCGGEPRCAQFCPTQTLEYR